MNDDEARSAALVERRCAAHGFCGSVLPTYVTPGHEPAPPEANARTLATQQEISDWFPDGDRR